MQNFRTLVQPILGEKYVSQKEIEERKMSSHTNGGPRSMCLRMHDTVTYSLIDMNELLWCKCLQSHITKKSPPNS